MSSFSVGYLARPEYKMQVESKLLEDEYVVEYNENWIGRFSSYDIDQEILPHILEQSWDVPFVRLHYFEDYNFRIQLIYQGEVQFYFYISYETESDAMFTLVATEKFGDNWEHIIYHTPEGEAYKKEVNDEVSRILEEGYTYLRYFSHLNEQSFEAFKLFGFDEEAIANIQQILSVERFSELPQFEPEPDEATYEEMQQLLLSGDYLDYDFEDDFLSIAQQTVEELLESLGFDNNFSFTGHKYVVDRLEGYK